jgi:hypothetical protein
MFFEKVPFDGSLQNCIKCVLDNERPKILVLKDDEEQSELKTVTKPICNLIRKCWLQIPQDRPNFQYILAELLKELKFYES